MEQQTRTAFVQTRLPWIIAVATLTLYVVTLNHWVSLASLPIVSAVTDPNGIPPLNAPLHFLLTYPFRWLPAGVQFIGLNVFAALCAALTLALLARSIALLPHDRTREQRMRERSEFSLLSIPAAWAPPVLAALICGLQITFWENATAETGEMLDLLLFAYVARCLLEYRVSQRENWLTKMALVYGLAVTNNYAMIAYFPAFVAALIWIKGKDFFDFRFVARMFGYGAIGLTLYFLLPLLAALNDNSGVGFWDALRLQLASQKNSILGFPRYVILIAGLSSLLPLLLIAIRWPSSFGDTSVAGAILSNAMFRVMNAVFLLAVIWVAFDAPISPRELMNKLLEGVDEAIAGVPMLSFYYLGALCAGYFAGYYLLVFGSEPSKSWHRPTGGMRFLNRVVTALTWMVIVAAPAGLLYKNFKALRANDGTLLHDYARLTTESLPASGAVLLSDSPFILGLTQARLNQTSDPGGHLLADTRLLPYTNYQRTLRERFPKVWPALPPSDKPTNFLVPPFLIFEITSLASSNAVYYLQPSFGYYFEAVYPRPRGLIYQLGVYATNAVAPPPPDAGEIEANQKFWRDASPALDRATALVHQNSRDARTVGRWYSRALDVWGVKLQRLGQLDEAGKYFEQAQRLNPDNVIAEANFNFNRSLRAGKSSAMQFNKSIEDQFDRYRSWNALLAANGPVDEPSLCYRLGQTFAQQSLFRQAALEFLRVQQLEPDNLDNRLWLANVFLYGQAPDQALEVVSSVRAHPPVQPLSTTNQIELARLEAMAHFSKGDTNASERILARACRQFPDSEALANSLLQVYLSANRVTNALAAIEEQLKRRPDNLAALLNKAYVCMKLEDYDRAGAAIDDVLNKDPKNIQALLDKGAIGIQTKAYREALDPLNQILKLQPDNQIALMNHAIASLQSGQLDIAEHEYKTLLKLMPTEHRIFYGLGEIAYRQTNTPVAIRQYESYLKYAPANMTNTTEYNEVLERLKGLKSNGR